MVKKIILLGTLAVAMAGSFFNYPSAAERLSREEKRQKERDELQERFRWWPTAFRRSRR